MTGLVETKAQRWRALAVYSDGREGLLYVGSSFSQVSEHYDEPYFDLLDDEEREQVCRILLQKWMGTPDRGNWQTQRQLPKPEVPVLMIATKKKVTG